MKVIVKVKFNATREKFEVFGANKYLVHLPFQEDTEANIVLARMLSRHLGVPPSKIKFAGFDPYKDRIFEIF